MMIISRAMSSSRRRFIRSAVVAGVGATLLPRFAFAQSKKLNVYNWDTYIGEKTISSFSEKMGVEVQYDLFANNEELFAKLKEGNPGYDVIFPSDYMLEAMHKAGMLVELDHSRIPNIQHVDPNFANPAFDPGLKHNVPYFWGTVGIGYRKSKVPEPTSWKVIFDSDEYAGRVATLADSRFVLAVVLMYLGYSPNTTNPDEINKAAELLIKQKKNIKAFVPDSGQDMLIAGDIDLVMEWNGDIIKVMEEDDDLSYVVPSEGTIVWTDGVCIPTDAPNLDNAYAFLNHIHDPQVNAEIANTIHYATTNKSAREFVNAEDLANPAVYPPDEVVKKSASLIDVGEALRHYDEAWVRVQAA